MNPAFQNHYRLVVSARPIYKRIDKTCRKAHQTSLILASDGQRSRLTALVLETNSSMNRAEPSLAPRQASQYSPNAQADDFIGFGLNSALLDALDIAGLSKPTPIQQMAIPALLKGRDLVGLAQTGTGKTVAFLLPLLEHLSAGLSVRAGQPPRALILTPTRELASQVHDTITHLTQELDIRHLVIFGGARYDKQIRGLKRGVDIVVATPGRLEDLMKRGVFDSQGVSHFIMDEADHMLDLGFYPAMKRISKTLPTKRQTMLFSATMPPKIRQLASEFLVNPDEVIAPQKGRTADTVSQRILILDEQEKRPRLARLLTEQGGDQSLVFVRTKRRAEQLAKKMAEQGFKIDALHGDMRQRLREKVLHKFRQGQLQTLVATDVAARGIDVSGIGLVVNFDLTDTAEAYVHRIGRTGRAGLAGLAVSLCGHQEKHKLQAIRKLVGAELDISGEEALPPAELGVKESPQKNRSWSKKSTRQRPAPKTTPDAPRDGEARLDTRPAHLRRAKSQPKPFNPAQPLAEDSVSEKRPKNGSDEGWSYRKRSKQPKNKPVARKSSARAEQAGGEYKKQKTKKKQFRPINKQNVQHPRSSRKKARSALVK